MMKRQVHTILFITMLLSCNDPFSTTLEIDPPAYEDFAVIIAESSQNQLVFELNLGATIPIIPNTENTNIEDALVQVFADDTFYFEMMNYPSNPGIPNYLFIDSVPIFRSSIQYQLKVSTSDYGEIQSEAMLPSVVIPESYSLEYDGGLNFSGEDRSAIKIVLDDPPGETNYYEAWVSRTYGGYDDFQDTYTEVNDPNFFRNLKYESIVFSDASFNGERKGISFLFNLADCCGGNDKFRLHWRNISQEYYDFSRTVRAQSEIEDNPFASPIQVTSNIENGLGIFSLYNVFIYDVE